MDEEKYVIFNPCDDYYDDYYRDDYDPWDKDYLEDLDIDYEFLDGVLEDIEEILDL